MKGARKLELCCFGFSVSSGEKQHKNGEAKHTCFLRCVYNRIIQKNKRYASIAACFRCLKKSGSLLWLSHFPCADLLVVFYGERKKNALQTIRCINPVFVCRLAEPDLAQPDRQNSSMPTFLMDKFLKMHLFSPYFAAFSSVL